MDGLQKVIERGRTKELANRLQTVVNLHLTNENAPTVVAVLLKLAGLYMTAPMMQELDEREKTVFVLNNVQLGYAEAMKELAIRAGRAADAFDANKKPLN
jgi:hypothetical protein